MTIEEQIRQKIEQGIAPESLKVVNQSHLHKGHAGDDGSGESHFKLEVVWGGFSAYSRIERERHVHSIMGKELLAKIHALQVFCLTSKDS